MAIIYTQTDTNSTIIDANNVGCSAGGNGSAQANKKAVNGGTAGTGTPAATLGSSQTNVCVVKFEIEPLSSDVWSSGTWTWRFNVTTANMNIQLDAAYICRLNSAGVNQATIGSVTGLATSMGTTGVKSGNITGSAQTPSAGDIVGVFFIFSNGAMSTQSINITPNQNIDSPFTQVTRTPRQTSIGHPFII